MEVIYDGNNPVLPAAGVTYPAVQDPLQQAVAILTMHDEERMFRGNHQNFIDLIAKGQELGMFVYVVTVRDMKPAAKRVLGFSYNPDTKGWKQLLLPLPDVVYNRIPLRSDELLPEVQQTIDLILRNSHVRLFNPSFFDKWTLFEWLSKAKTTKKYIPATRRLSQAAELEALLLQHPIVYLKPVRGKAGKGIMKVERTLVKTKPYLLTIQNDKASIITRHPNLDNLWNKLKTMMATEDYIVQQGIQLANFNKRPFDLRVLVQKNHLGQWSLTGIGARVAGKQSITTHVPRGGRIDEPEKLLNAVFGPELTKSILVRVKTSSFAIARQIEKASGHMLGEMSMDLGVDAFGQIWFFEANSRPMKFDEPDIRKKSLERIIQYSQFLIKSRKKSR